MALWTVNPNATHSYAAVFLRAYRESCSNLSFAAWLAITGDQSYKKLERGDW